MMLRRFLLAVALGALVPATMPITSLAASAPLAPLGHSRLLPLEGGQNFRDLGGYRTKDGRAVRWGVLFRSGAMNRLTPADFAYLARIGIRTVCDFRSTAERQSAPARWPATATPTVFADDYAMDPNQLDFRKAAGWNAAQARAAMAAFYPRLLDTFNGQYRRMFRELLAGDTPLAFNCTAGKDRTGVAAALLLTALDVPRETIIADYLLSNRYLDPGKVLMADDHAAQALRRLPPGVAKAFMGVDRSYIEAVFRVIDAHPGGVTGYLRDELGLDRGDLLRLRALYTVR